MAKKTTYQDLVHQKFNVTNLHVEKYPKSHFKKMLAYAADKVKDKLN